MGAWSEWFSHDGNGPPVGIDGHFIGVEFRCGHVWEGVYGADHGKTDKGAPVAYGDGRKSSWRWGTYHPKWDAIRYRIRRPKGMAILEQLLADIPAPVAPEVVE